MAEQEVLASMVDYSQKLIFIVCSARLL